MFRSESIELKIISKMVSTSSKMIVVCVVLCLAGSALCQTESSAPNTSEVAEGRTFGHHFLKRLSFAIIPTAFVVGVIMTLLAALTVVSIKGLGIGVSALGEFPISLAL